MCIPAKLEGATPFECRRQTRVDANHRDRVEWSCTVTGNADRSSSAGRRTIFCEGLRPMNTLVIYHTGDAEAPKFEVHRLPDGMRTAAVAVPSPVGFPVEDLPNSDLMRQLRWYLEQFLDYPFPPATDRADRVLAALKDWGQRAFRALFDNMQAGLWYQSAVAQGGENLQLQISSDDPRILAWPWEALCNPQTDYLALHCHIERKLNTVADPLPLPDNLPNDRVNILLVTARPYEADVQYRSISRPLVELIESPHKKLPAEVTVLRPPTFDRLREHLRERPDHYHILHFDGHGGYGVDPTGGSDPFTLQAAPQGRLVFETDDGEPDPIDAAVLSQLLREHRLPAVVLNACQSGMVDQAADDAFASVAASLIKAGIRSVVAMAYSLYVSGAQQFLPAFYRRLFEAGDLAQPTRAGRQQMLHKSLRVCARGEYPLADWLVPVVYQQQPLDFSFAAQAAPREPTQPTPQLPPDAVDTANPYGFVGRDGPILELERAMRRPPAGILIHGLGGVGKTTLARGFVQWLRSTGGLGHGCFWLTFNDIRSAELVFNHIGTALFGANFITVPLDRKIATLAEALRQHPFVIVWDNFESATGIDSAAVEPTLSDDDRQLLRTFLEQLRGGRTKVIITSRSEEDWLGHTNRYKVPVRGLAGEERWEYCRAILADLNITINHDDPELAALMDALDGHPLMMRAILPMLDGRSAAAIAEALRTNLDDLPLEGDDTRAKVLATLRFVEQSLPEDLQPLLTPLSLHERFADADYLEEMAKQVEANWTRPRIDRFLTALSIAGLVRELGQTVYELHPALTGFLRSARLADASRDDWARAYVDVMGSLADALAPRQLHEQRIPFHLHGTNFHFALGEAERLDMQTDFAALTQSLAAYALNVRDFGTAEKLFTRLAESRAALGDPKIRAGAYHQVGRIAEERRDFEQAEKWYLKSLAITEKQGNEHGAALTYHQLGRIAQERRDFAQAEKWYLKSLAIKKKQGNEHGAAITYHQLGTIAQEARDFAQAEKWYLKALAVFEEQGNEHGAANTYGQLGILAGLRGQYVECGRWLIKGIQKFGQCHDPAGAQQSAHNFMIAHGRATPEDQARLKEMWQDAGLGELPAGDDAGDE